MAPSGSVITWSGVSRSSGSKRRLPVSLPLVCCVLLWSLLPGLWGRLSMSSSISLSEHLMSAAWLLRTNFGASIFAFVAFFVTVCYHTVYAPPWIYPPLALYGLDMLLRFLRYRIKDATLTPISNHITMVSTFQWSGLSYTHPLCCQINIPFCTDGWTAGQHIRLRVFFEGRIFEAHPLSIITAPPSTSCLTNVYTPGITLGVRVIGDWSRALNRFALNKGYLEEEGPESKEEKSDDHESTECDSSAPQTQVQVMMDGPYGGCTVDLGRYETILLFAGGAGVTFTLGMLDDIVGRCVRLGRQSGEKTRRIEFAWCIKSFG